MQCFVDAVLHNFIARLQALGKLGLPSAPQAAAETVLALII